MPDNPDEPTRVKCKLNVSGTDAANANVVDDLLVDDPEQEKAEAAIKEATDGNRNNA